MKYEIGQKVKILNNPIQPWTVNHVGTIEKVETKKNPISSRLQGIFPWYYVGVELSKGHWAGCVLSGNDIDAL